MVKAKNKKVHPQMNNTIKNSDYQELGVPRAIFIPHGNSLPFEERRVTLEQPVKIGRNVYKVTPSPTNTIFECRVLSRHHATLYYDKGHFYLVDNQSSNGTFINNNRCSISSSQEPHEVFSGDIVMFGISVVENVPNSGMNQTFPPVIAMLKLFHPDGKEAKLSFNPTMTMPLDLKELYQLNNYVQDAIQREASLESRLRTLRECVERTRASAAAAWEVFVGEQRLLMRVRTLEAALAAGRTPEPDHLAQLLNDKKNYQEVAVESLRAAHEQRLALEESLERRSREAAALQHHNAALRHHTAAALHDFQKLASRWCERKISAARAAVAAAEEREAAARQHLPIACAVENGSTRMLVTSEAESAATDGGGGGGALEDAVRALPDYVKLLLPNHVLGKVGMKVISSEGKTAKEFELILQQNNIYDERLSEKESDSSPSESAEPRADSDDEKQARLYLESTKEVPACELPDNNANSTYSDADLRDDDTNKIPSDMASILRVVSGLNEEVRSLRGRLAAEKEATERLKAARDELLAAAETPDPDFEDVAAYRARIADLQAQLTRANVADEVNLAEIQRLTSNAATLQGELNSRPTRADLDDLTAEIQRLQTQLNEKDQLLQQYQTNPPSSTTTHTQREDKSTETDDPNHDSIDVGKVTAEIDDLFRLEDDDDETSDSVVTEVMTEADESKLDYVKLDDEQRLEVTLANGSLHALEDELVRAKEGWAEANRERAILAAQLMSLKDRPVVNLTRILVLALPLVAVALAWLAFPTLS